MRLPKCPECGNRGMLASGKEVYPHRPDLYHKWFYVCDIHDTRVGCHPNTTDPLSYKMAGAPLRLLRSQTHKEFDPLWINGHFKSRGLAYLWLAKQMEISTKDCHISYFNQAQCHSAISILHSYCNQLQVAAYKEKEIDKWKPKNSLFKVNKNET